MKDARSLRRASLAAINEAIREADRLSALLGEMHLQFANEHGLPKLDGKRMAVARGMAERINQRVHEFSAYSNALLTE